MKNATKLRMMAAVAAVLIASGGVARADAFTDAWIQLNNQLLDLHNGITQGQADIAEWLVEGEPVISDPDDWTAFEAACEDAYEDYQSAEADHEAAVIDLGAASQAYTLYTQTNNQVWLDLAWQKLTDAALNGVDAAEHKFDADQHRDAAWAIYEPYLNSGPE